MQDIYSAGLRPAAARLRAQHAHDHLGAAIPVDIREQLDLRPHGVRRRIPEKARLPRIEARVAHDRPRRDVDHAVVRSVGIEMAGRDEQVGLPVAGHVARTCPGAG